MKTCFGHVFGQERAVSDLFDPRGLLSFYIRADGLVPIDCMAEAALGAWAAFFFTARLP